MNKVTLIALFIDIFYHKYVKHIHKNILISFPVKQVNYRGVTSVVDCDFADFYRDHHYILQHTVYLIIFLI